MLTWTLLIATYNRADILRICIELALNQTRCPTEIVVVDASPDWATSAADITLLAEPRADVKLTYCRAWEKSLTAQRNQGMTHVTSDVVFMLDDDSLMYSNCAERIMNVYEADVEEVIAGVQAAVSNTPPTEVPGDIAVKPRGKSRTHFGILGKAQSLAMRQIVLFDVEALFIPYDGAYPDVALPSSIMDLEFRSARLFSGFRMTYRTTAARKEPFNATLRSYCPGEDTDASFRISRHGALVTASNAHVFHYQSASGRIDRKKTETLSALNHAFLLRSNATNLPQLKRAYYRKMARRVVAEVLKDTVTRRHTFPQLRGVIRAIWLSRSIFVRDDAGLDEWYIATQLAILDDRPVPVNRPNRWRWGVRS